MGYSCWSRFRVLETQYFLAGHHQCHRLSLCIANFMLARYNACAFDGKDIRCTCTRFSRTITRASFEFSSWGLEPNESSDHCVVQLLRELLLQVFDFVDKLQSAGLSAGFDGH